MSASNDYTQVRAQWMLGGVWDRLLLYRLTRAEPANESHPGGA